MDEPEFCAGCLRDNEETKAVAWCSNCSEWVCKPCGRVHARFAIPHKVVPTKEAKKLSSSVLQLSKNCAIHSDQRIILFCIQHDTIVCASCVPELHQNCKSVMSIEKVAKGVRTGTAIDDLETRLSNLCHVIKNILSENFTNISQLEDQKKQIRKKIKTIRQQINVHLDHLEDGLDNELMKSFATLKEKSENIKTDLKNKLDDAEKWQNDIRSLKEHGSDIHLFQSIKFLDNKTHKQESEMRNLQRRIKTPKMVFRPSTNAIEFKTILPSLGIIEIEESPSLETAVHALDIEQKGQCATVEGAITLMSSFETANLNPKSTINSGCFISRNQLLLADTTNRCLYVCKTDGTDYIKIDLDDYPLQVNIYDANRALIVLSHTGIRVFDLNFLSCGNYIVKSRDCASITNVGGRIWYTRGIGTLCEIDIDGKDLNTVQPKCYLNKIAITSTGHIYCTSLNFGGEGIYIVSPEGKSKLFFKSPQLEKANGVAIDDKGNVLVSGSTFSNIHKISKDGKHSESILTAENGLNHPGLLTYCHESKHMLVANNNGKSVLIYKI